MPPQTTTPTPTVPEQSRRYKPKLKELSQNQLNAVHKYAIVADTDTLKLLRDHIQTAFINDVLFTVDPTTGRTKDVNDQYFRGVLDGIDIIYDFIHEKAEMERNPSLQTQ